MKLYIIILSILINSISLASTQTKKDIPMFHNSRYPLESIDVSDYMGGLGMVGDILGRKWDVKMTKGYREKFGNIHFSRYLYEIIESQENYEMFKNAPYPFTVQDVFYEWNGIPQYIGYFFYYGVVDEHTFIANSTDPNYTYRPPTVEFRNNVMPLKNSKGYGFMRYNIESGKNTEYAYVYFIKEDGSLNRTQSGLLIEDIYITNSTSLRDANNPFRYSIQNAFDGNPATSYVENTKDDLMEITFRFEEPVTITKIAIINGYAENMDLYMKNNRIKQIRIDGALMSRVFADSNLLPQILKFNYTFASKDFKFSIDSLYKGSHWSDTCLALFDIHTEEHGWLFGGDYE